MHFTLLVTTELLSLTLLFPMSPIEEVSILTSALQNTTIRMETRMEMEMGSTIGIGMGTL